MSRVANSVTEYKISITFNVTVNSVHTIIMVKLGLL